MKNYYSKHVLSAFLTLCIVSLCLCACSKSVKIQTTDGTLVLSPLYSNAVRVQVIPDGQTLPEELVYTEKVRTPAFKVKKSDAATELSTARMTVRYSNDNGTLSFLDAQGNVLLSEVPGGRKLQPSTVQDVPVYAVSQSFVSPKDEHLYGTGQFQDGYLDIRGLTRRLTQVNTQIAIPFVMSSKGYGLLWNNYGLTDFNPAGNSVVLTPAEEGAGQTVNATGTSGNRREMRFSRTFTGTLEIPQDGDYALLLDVGQKMARRHFLSIDDVPVIDISNTWLPPTASVIVTVPAGRHSLSVEGVRGDNPQVYWRKVTDETTLSSPVAAALDYTVFAGSGDEVISTYRTLTGPVPRMADWMFGYIHCRERYHSQDEILENAAGFKERGLPLDVIVQDWQWWGNTGWNSMEFDRVHYPDPAALTSALHNMGTRFMISVWSKVDRNCSLGQKLNERGYYIDGTDWIDFFQPEAAAFYLQSFRDSLAIPYGIDAWWFDATEPENDDLAGRLVGPDKVPGELYRNVYPLMVNSTMYKGLKDVTPDHEPVILTRSAFTGIQRYGVVTWSGDVGNDFGTLRRQIAGGLGQMAAGLPWWTYDAGGFFRPGDQYTSEEYQERLVRWVQASVFLPFMRVHGYMSQTEPWRYSEQTYNLMAAAMKQREQLRPYILDCAKKVSEEGYTLMRPLVFDFADDPEALRQDCEFMFGPKYLVCPVTEAGVSSWRVYLPKNEGGWTDTRSGQRYEGGRYADVPVDITAIPVFVRE
ncbi:MAG: DUF4968 domain-containing protein [Bacteroidales bacterium]|nr:DUF4968 domain-containing protein [Bacteroidales bacterium]